MKKFSRAALFLGCTLIALVMIALLAVNLYVQSKGTQAWIQQELSERLGTTLRIQRISVTPWWGLKLTGITMPQEDASIPGDFLRAETFRLRVRFGSLFSERLVINEISLIRPTVVWAQNEDGKWRLPTLPRSLDVDPPAGEAAPAPDAPPLRETDPGVPIDALPQEPAAAQRSAFTPEVRRVTLMDGTFRFLDAEKKPIATFERLRFRSNFRTATELRGNASIAKTSLRDRFFLEDLQSPLSYDPSELDFSEITARAAGGEITGRFTMRPGDADSPFKVTVKFRDLDADRIVSEARGPLGMVEGKLEGHLEAAGKTADPNALTGVGEIHLRDGQVRQYSLLVALGQLLQIDELTQLRFDQAQVKYHIQPGLVTIDELLLSSANIRLSAVGTITFGGKLRLESQLAINEKIRGQLFQPISDNFRPIEQPGFAAIDFQVRGTLDKPKTDLMDKLVGSQLKDLSGVISSFLGGGKPDRAKKKKRPDEPAVAAPSDSARPGEAERDAAVPPTSPQPDTPVADTAESPQPAPSSSP